MNLYQAPRNSYVKISTGDIINFKWVDGMYSLNLTPKGICHIWCMEEVEIVTKEDYLNYWRNYETT